MKIHNVIQGSKEWEELRARVKHTASDLSAIRGNSKYKTRADAIREAATGIKPEISAFQQKKFDEGHATEAMARSILEQRIGKLFTGTATTDDEYLLASSDGYTMMGDVGFEHKLWNEDLAAKVRAGQLDPMYTDQMDQQIAVFGFDKIVFVVSDGTPDKWEETEYAGNPESIARIRADWAQFDEDVAKYQHVEVAQPAVGQAPETLPALRIEVTGMVTASNLDAFKERALAVIGAVKTELKTDQDFADAEKSVKWCEEVETRLNGAKQHALSQTESIDALFKTIDDIKEQARAVRLKLEKLVKAEKENRKAELVREYCFGFQEHMQNIADRLGIDGVMKHFSMPQFSEAIKGLKTLDSMRDKLSVALANAKVESNGIADRIEANRKTVEDMTLFPDFAQVCTKAPEDFSALLALRIAQRKEAEEKRLEAEREKIRREEQAKAEAAARAQREAEEAAARAQQQEAERAAQQQAAQVIEAAKVEKAADDAAAAKCIAPIIAAEIAARQEEPAATLKLGEINAALGVVSITADQLAALGFKPHTTDKSAKLYLASHFPLICAAIARHITAVANAPVKLAA